MLGGLNDYRKYESGLERLIRWFMMRWTPAFAGMTRDREIDR